MTHERPPLPEGMEEGEQGPSKADYFRKLAAKYNAGMRLLFRGGHLWGPDKGDPRGWRNVVEHSLVQTAAAEELVKMLRESLSADEIAGLLGVPPEDLDKLSATAIIHDWDKKYERMGGEPNERELRHLAPLRPDPLLMEATKIPVLEQLYLGNKAYTPMQDLQFYVDIITRENEIATAEERIAEVSSSPRAADVGRKANGAFWEGNRAHAKRAEAMLFGALHGKVEGLEKPEDIALLLKKRIEAHWTTPPA